MDDADSQTTGPADDHDVAMQDATQARTAERLAKIVNDVSTVSSVSYNRKKSATVVLRVCLHS